MRMRPPLAWYSSDSAPNRSAPARSGHVTATRPPSLSTRKISAIAVASSGMCSSTSDAMTRSTLASGKGRQVAPDDLVASAGRRLAGLGDRTQPALRRRHLGQPPVDGDHRRAPAHGLEGVPALAAAEVEQDHARLHAEPVVVDGQHGAAVRSIRSRSRTSSRRHARRAASHSRLRTRDVPRPSLTCRGVAYQGAAAAPAEAARPRRPASRSPAPAAARRSARRRRPPAPAAPPRRRPLGQGTGVGGDHEGVAQAMASTAGSEKPSYSDGMATTAARCSRSTSSASGTGQ